MTIRPNRFVLAAVAVTGLLLATSVTSPVAAAPAAGDAAPSATTAVVRAAHFSPNTPGVDVYLSSFSGGSSALWLSDIGYGDVSSYRSIASGLYVVSMRAHGASPSSPAALSWNLDARAGRAYTVAAAGMNADLTGVVVNDNLDAPPAGKGLVRVIQASSRAQKAEVVASPDTVLAPSAAFASTSSYVSVPAGTWTVRASALTPPVVSASSPVQIGSGSINTIVVLDAKTSGIELRTVRDASGTATTPAGSINAGGGGTALRLGDSSSSTPSALVAAAVALVASAAVLDGLRRRRSLRTR